MIYLQAKCYTKLILLKDRSAIKISGVDAETFLQGLITNDIFKLKTEKAIYAFLLSPQGKYLFDFIVYSSEEGYVLDCASARKDELLKKLKMYKLRAKVEIEDLPNLKIYSDFETGVADPRHSKLGNRILSEDDLEQSDFAEYESLRISLGVPASNDFIVDKSFIQQYRADELNAIDYKKGCYVGQEIIARTHYKGQIRKSLFVAKGELPSFGEEILMDGKKIGIMLNSNGEIGLALCDIEAAKNFTNGKFILTGAN